jgi:hypothetical protein
MALLFVKKILVVPIKTDPKTQTQTTTQTQHQQQSTPSFPGMGGMPQMPSGMPSPSTLSFCVKFFRFFLFPIFFFRCSYFSRF